MGNKQNGLSFATGSPYSQVHPHNLKPKPETKTTSDNSEK